MFKKIISVLIFVLFCFSFADSSIKNTKEIEFTEGINYYKQKEYKSALSSFLEITKSGVKNGELCYNIGNTYFKLDDIGRSILWYEKAKKLIPNDPDLEFNLKYLNSFVKDEREEKPSLFYDIFFFWKKPFNSQTIQYVAIILNFLFFAILSLNLILRKRGLKPFVFILMLLSILFIATSLYDLTKAKNFKSAVVLSEVAIIRSGFSIDATELFRLHTGTKVKIEEERENHYKIIFSKGKIGWIKKEFLGVI